MSAEVTEQKRSSALTWLSQMLLIRHFEERGEQLTLRGKVPGGMHPAGGQEAVAVGFAGALEPGDTVAAPHRGHHHALAKGITPRALMAELYGKATGICGGRGGSMHLADFSVGFIGSNGIVGASVGLALGDAFAARQRGESRVAVAFFGDGGVNTGRTWEFVNLASAWKLPLVVVCENNLYAVETTTSKVTGGGSIVDRAAGFGLPAVGVDGQDINEVHAAATAARARAVAGDGPTFIEAQTYRFSGHGSGETPTYRTEDEVAEWRKRDPIERLKRQLIDAGELDDEGFDALAHEADAIVEDAVTFAEESPWPAT